MDPEHGVFVVAMIPEPMWPGGRLTLVDVFACFSPPFATRDEASAWRWEKIRENRRWRDSAVCQLHATKAVTFGGDNALLASVLMDMAKGVESVCARMEAGTISTADAVRKLREVAS